MALRSAPRSIRARRKSRDAGFCGDDLPRIPLAATQSGVTPVVGSGQLMQSSGGPGESSSSLGVDGDGADGEEVCGDEISYHLGGRGVLVLVPN